MADVVVVDDLSDARLAPYQDLRDPIRMQRSGRFIAEGRAVFARMVASGRHEVESVVLSSAALEATAASVAQLPADTPVYLLASSDIRKTAGFAIHQGCLALALRGPEPETRAVLGRDPSTVVLLHQLADPDNVGSIFRSTLALGGDAVLISQGTADPLYRKTIRTSMGAVFDVPYGRSPSLEADISSLRDRGYLIAALTPHEPAAAARDWVSTLPPAQRVALVAGNEGHGLPPDLLAAVDVRVRVPMRPGIDSVNVHTSVAIVLALLGRV